MEVEAHSAELADVQRLVVEGALALTDLVNLGAEWQTIGECPEFLDACEQRRLFVRRRRVRRIGVALLFALAVAVAIAALWVAH